MRLLRSLWVAALVLQASAMALAQSRVALVIGNADYARSPLKNPTNDAKDFANSLRGYGFTVLERTNLTTKQIGPTLREFRSKLSPGSVAVVFYAGHGLQIKGENYLPAVDADIHGEEDVPTQSMSTRQLMDVLADAKTRMNLVFLDACRDNPYARSFRSASQGLSRENAPSGTLISFATRPGSVAADGEGRNGLYTSVLLQQMRQSNQPIEQVLKRVVSGVRAGSKGQQEPWMEGSIEGDFCFDQCGGSTTPSANVASSPMPSQDRMSVNDFVREQEARTKWNERMQTMRLDFQKVSGLSVEPSIKANAWTQFLEVYKEKNPFSDEDEQLRTEARSRLRVAEEDKKRQEASRQTPVATSPPNAPVSREGGEIMELFKQQVDKGNAKEKSKDQPDPGLEIFKAIIKNIM